MDRARGRWTARGRIALLAPALVIFGFCFVAPLSYFLVISFWEVKRFKLTPAATLANYHEVYDEYSAVLIFTFAIALAIGVLTSVLAFTFAYGIRFKVGRYGPHLLFAALITLFGGYLVKIYAWKTILGTQGILNSLLLRLGVVDEPLRIFIFNPGAVVVTLVHFLLPLAVLPIYASLRGISDISLEAARDLGAAPWRVFVDIVLPQCRTGVVAAFAFSFLISAGDYVTPQLVGGPQTSMIGLFISSAFGLRLDWPLGSAMSYTILLICTATVLIVRAALAAWRPR